MRLLKVFRMHYILYIILFVAIFNIATSTNSSALTYQKNVNVQFTFGSTLNITLSSADLIIPNLAPGTYDDSNIITVNVETNATYGYTLSAATGNGTTYTNTDLVNSSDSDTTTKKFTSLATTASYASMASANDNYWGYSYSSDNGSTWANYSGLPYCTPVDNECTQGTALISTTNATESNSIKFKIGAKASSDKPAGTYKNVINFFAVAVPEPVTFSTAYENAGKTQLNGFYKLQDMNSSICSAVEVYDENSQTQVIDTRDNKIYWIAKLQDEHCWMTQNLDLDLSTSVTLTHADTDLGWDSDTATQSWTPTNTTQTVTYDTDMKGTFTSIGTSNSSPSSLDVGNWYAAGSASDENINYLTSNNRTNLNGVITVNNGSGVDYFSTAPFTTNGTHGHVGNYYNWAAAVASNDTSSYTSSTYNNITNNPQNSICPAGWRLPTITGANPPYTSPGSKNEYKRLMHLYLNTTYELNTPPLYYLWTGYINTNSLLDSGGGSYTWSSTSFNSSNSYSLGIYTSEIDEELGSSRNQALTIRCLAR